MTDSLIHNNQTPNEEINESFDEEDNADSAMSHGNAPGHGIGAVASIAAGDATRENTEDLEYEEPNSPEAMISDAESSS